MWSLFGKKSAPAAGAVRTRFAPSPTGYLHVGGLRTALYDYLVARQQQGTFILRVEDTDQARSVPGAIENMLESLAWAGLMPDEGVVLDADGKIAQRGDHGPYIQSERLEIYREHAEELLAAGHAYHCFCSPERLTQLRETQQAQKLPTRYDGQCRTLSPEDVQQRRAAGEVGVIRLRVPEGEEVAFDDIIRGRVSFQSSDIDDQVLLKSDGFPTYHLACVVDDHLMAITHVIRGEEWLSSTPKHLILYRYFGWQPPVFAHLPLLLNSDKSKLSKRQGDVAVGDYKQKGYLPQAMVNFVALLGWHPQGDRELLSLDELVAQFDLSQVHKAGAVFDLAKLDWMNSEYIKQLPLDDLVKLAQPILKQKFGPAIDAIDLAPIVALEQSRIKTLSEVGDGVGFVFSDELNYDPANLVWKKSDAATTQARLEALSEHLAALSDWTTSKLEEQVLAWISEQGWTNGEVLWPMRWALTGIDRSPTPFEVASILGRERTLARLDRAAQCLAN